MNDFGSLIVDREPLDWILFNKILMRQKNAKPASHGNYNMSLSVAKAIIERDMKENDDVDLDDLPSYAIIFLSDGKPSDRTEQDAIHRNEIIRELADMLKSKLTMFNIGLGASDADFGTLSSMADVATSCGADGKFEFAQLSAAKLSATFSSLSTTMTATRTELLAVKDGEASKMKHVRLRKRGEIQGKYKRYVRGISRWHYDHEKYRSNDRPSRWYPWTEIDFKNRDAVGFDMEEDPFGKGAERLAYMFHEIDGSGTRVGKSMVAKESNKIDSEERKIHFRASFCRAQRKANELANLFNDAVKKSPRLRPVEWGMETPMVSFLKCFIYEFLADDNEQCGLLVQDYLKGKFTKYNGNNGLVYKNRNGPMIELEIGTVYLTDFLQAFSHWTYVHSDHKLMVCDLQGVLNEEGRHPRFQLTDPCICTKTRRESRKYGKTNLGIKGVRNFRKTHVCSPVCAGLGLPAF